MTGLALRMKYRKLDKFVQKLSNTQKVALNTYLMSGEGPLPLGSNLDAVLSYLVSIEPNEWDETVKTSLSWVEQNNVSVEGNQFEVASSRRQLNFTINATDNIDPTVVLLVSRDIGDETKLTLQEINVDSGDYIPVPVNSIAGILREYADVIEKRQEQLNQWDMN